MSGFPGFDGMQTSVTVGAPAPTAEAPMSPAAKAKQPRAKKLKPVVEAPPVRTDGVLVLGVDTGPTSHSWALIRVHDLQSASYLACGELPVTADPIKGERGPELAGLLGQRALMAIERPAGGGFSLAIIPPLLETSYQAGILAGIALCHCLTVRAMCAADWRREACGKGSANDAAVKASILRLVAGWPKASNAHERDAAGVALAVGWVWLRQQAEKAVAQ